MDMWDPYIASTLAHVPNGEKKIVFDRFHIMKQMNEAVDAVRKEENRLLLEDDFDILKGTKYLWLYAEENTPETVETPAPAPDIDQDTSSKSENAPPQASGVNSSPSKDPAVPAPEPSPASFSAPPQSSPVTAKPSTGNEGRKRIRILNPGNTVILEFGPDRRH